MEELLNKKFNWEEKGFLHGYKKDKEKLSNSFDIVRDFILNNDIKDEKLVRIVFPIVRRIMSLDENALDGALLNDESILKFLNQISVIIEKLTEVFNTIVSAEEMDIEAESTSLFCDIYSRHYKILTNE